MSEQIFISYRREGGDIYAKAICDALKVRGFTVFYDFDSLQGGFFDERIIRAIEECTDFVLILPQGALDRCHNEDDWVHLEIKHALKCGKNIIPVMLPGFTFPQNLPDDIACISKINGIPFIMAYFDRAVIPEIIDRLSTASVSSVQQTYVPVSQPNHNWSEGLEFTPNDDGGYSVRQGNCIDTENYDTHDNHEAQYEQSGVDQIAALRPGDLLQLSVHLLEAAANFDGSILAESDSLLKEIALLGFRIGIGH